MMLFLSVLGFVGGIAIMKFGGDVYLRALDVQLKNPDMEAALLEVARLKRRFIIVSLVGLVPVTLGALGLLLGALGLLGGG